MRTILHNALLFDPRSGMRRPGGLVLEGGQIARLLAPGQTFNSGAQHVDCDGRLLMPGLYDAHVHLVFGGESLQRLHAVDFPDRHALLEEVARRARAVSAPPTKRGGWVLGQALSQSADVPTLAELDEAAGGVPLCLDTHDLHSCCCNSAALALAGVDERRADPPGGAVGHDADGRLNGFLMENAALWMRPVIPAASDVDRLGFILAAQKHAHALGIIGVGENLRRADLPLFQRLETENRLRLRIQGWRNDGNLAPDTFDLETWFSPRIRVDTLKLFADGALGSRSAALSQPYLDGSRGVLVAAPEDLKLWMRLGLERGWRLAVHAIGDLAVKRILDLFEELGHDGLPVKGYRHRIEHAQFVQVADISRFRSLEIIPSVQPLHCATDQDGFAARLNPEQVDIAFPWRSFLDMGLSLPLGTDWPVEPLDPRLNLFHGSTRLSKRGLNLIGTAEALDVATLLRGMTWDATQAAGWGEGLGCLEPGAHADLLLWEDDPLTASAEDLTHLRIRGVWSGGEQVWEPQA